MSPKFGGKEEGRICPRCGNPYSYVEVRRYHNPSTGTTQEYRFAVHYVKVGDRRRKRRCTLGPIAYIHGTQTQVDVGLVVRGLMVEGKLEEYLGSLIMGLRDLVKEGRFERRNVKEIIRVLQEGIDALKTAAGVDGGAERASQASTAENAG